MRIFQSVIICLSVILLGCSSQERPIRIGTGVWPGFEPLYLAREHMFFSNDNVRLVEMPSSHEVVNALIAGELEGAGISLDEAISVSAEGIPLQIVLVFDVSGDADAIVSRSDASLENALSNHPLALNFGTTSRLLLDAALTSIGQEQPNYAPLNLSPTQQVSAWGDGSINLAATREPYLSQLVARGATPVFTGTKIHGRIVDVLVVRQDLAITQSHQLKDLIRGFFQAREQMITLKEPYLTIAQQRLKLTLEQLTKSYSAIHMPGLEENYRLLNKDSGRLRRTTETLMSLMQVNGMLPSESDVPLNVSTEFLPELK